MAKAVDDHLAAKFFLVCTIVAFPFLLFACDSNLTPRQGPAPIGGGSTLTGAGGSAVPDFCGDNIATGAEQCDGIDLKGATCDSFSLTGVLLCAGCQYDLSGCRNSDAVSSSAGGSAAISGAIATGGMAGIGGVSGSAGIAGVGGVAGSAGVAGVAGSAGIAGVGGIAGSAGVAGVAGSAGSGGAVVPPKECTPSETETLDCGSCGEQTRTCSTDGKWGTTTACDDPCADLPPECAGQSDIPTWDGSVGTIVQRSCATCHAQARQYSSVVSWRNFDSFVQRQHFIMGTDQQIVICWIALGKPQN